MENIEVGDIFLLENPNQSYLLSNEKKYGIFLIVKKREGQINTIWKQSNSALNSKKLVSYLERAYIPFLEDDSNYLWSSLLSIEKQFNYPSLLSTLSTRTVYSYQLERLFMNQNKDYSFKKVSKNIGTDLKRLPPKPNMPNI